MRDLFLLAVLLGVAPLIFRAPILGLLTWLWITLMSPQREVYGFLSNFELNFYVAAITAAGWALSKERKMFPTDLAMGFLVLFALWSSVCTYVALDRGYSLAIWDRTMKTIVLALAVATLANTKTRIQAVLWIFAAAIGYYAVKGGGFVLLTGGRQHVFGPENTMIEDNNSIGLMFVVLLPLMNYLRLTSRIPFTRLICLGVMVCTLLAVIGTYSRGALLALVAAGAAYVFKSRSGVLLALLAAVLVVSLPAVLPASWLERMSTIQTYERDASFEGRRAAWTTSLNIAKARPFTGGGFSAVDLDAVAQQFQSPGSLKAGKAAHSIYFEVLGDTGFVGLGLYLLMVASAALNTSLVLAATRGRAELAWANLLARMLQVSMVAMLVGGAALSMAYYDGFLVLLALTTSLLQVVRRAESLSADADGLPVWRRATPAIGAPVARNS
jgi:probable O-glycosylation ligase (exosortase A-associated)